MHTVDINLAHYVPLSSCQVETPKFLQNWQLAGQRQFTQIVGYSVGAELIAVLAERITELIRFEPEICICNGN